jgi:hypothetical protein
VPTAAPPAPIPPAPEPDPPGLIRIFASDDAATAKWRQGEIVKRLEELGAGNVRGMIGNSLPTNWDPIIREWLKGK